MKHSDLLESRFEMKAVNIFLFKKSAFYLLVYICRYLRFAGRSIRMFFTSYPSFHAQIDDKSDANSNLN